MNQVIFIFLIFSSTLYSCSRVKDEGKEVVAKIKQKVKDKSEDLVDKVAPHFNAYEADTKFNKERFREFLQIELTSDIKNIHCFDDAIGIDADYQFSFNCDTTTVTRIIERHKLVMDTINSDFSFGLQDNFDWWDKKKIKKLQLYSWEGNHRYFKNFWYDSIEQKAYYFDFDM